MEKTIKCVVPNCPCDPVVWKGFLIKSRDRVAAGFCENHTEEKCPNTFGKNNCYGIYNKGLGTTPLNNNN